MLECTELRRDRSINGSSPSLTKSTEKQRTFLVVYLKLFSQLTPTTYYVYESISRDDVVLF